MNHLSGVADFDESLASKKSWIEECRLFISACNSYQLPAYLEHYSSGKGGHVWIFFDAAYPAYKSRKIALHICHLGRCSAFSLSISILIPSAAAEGAIKILT